MITCSVGERTHGTRRDRRGVAVLGVTVTTFFAALLLALSIQLIGVNDLLSGFTEAQSERAYQVADSCGDEALLRLKRDSAYTGGTLSVGTDSCTITVTGGGTTRSIAVTAVAGRTTRRILIAITLVSGTVTVTDWAEDTTSS